MKIERFIILCFLVCLIEAYRIDATYKRQHQSRQRRGLDVSSWPSAGTLLKKFHLNTNQQNADARATRSEMPLELRPVEGPISIEQLPAMLAARSVKRYPYSQQDDPAIIGR